MPLEQGDRQAMSGSDLRGCEARKSRTLNAQIVASLWDRIVPVGWTRSSLQQGGDALVFRALSLGSHGLGSPVRDALFLHSLIGAHVVWLQPRALKAGTTPRAQPLATSR